LKNIILLSSIILSSNVFAAANHCGDIETIRTWANGNDTYGIWVEYDSNPTQCSGGFYIPHEGNNKQFVYSTLLASKMANQKICIQVYSYDTNIGNRCKLHYVYHPET
jgi:hypothetical protein